MYVYIYNICIYIYMYIAIKLYAASLAVDGLLVLRGS